MGGHREKHKRQGLGCRADLSLCLLHREEFLEIQSFFSSRYREGDTLINVNVSYKRVISTWFS